MAAGSSGRNVFVVSWDEDDAIHLASVLSEAGWIVALEHTDGNQVGFAALTGPIDVGAAVPVTPGKYYVQVVPYTASKGSPYVLGLTLVSD
jgi:hypothetical protein